MQLVHADSQAHRSTAPNHIHLFYRTFLLRKDNGLTASRSKRHAEAYIIESTLNYTILSLGLIADEFQMEAINASGVTHARWDPDVLMSLTTFYDLAEMTARILIECETHFCAQYQAISINTMSFREMCKKLEDVTGRKIRIEMMSLEDASAVVPGGENSSGLSLTRGEKAAASRMILHYNEHGLRGNSNIMEYILRRATMNFEEWIRSRIAIARGSRFDLLHSKEDEDASGGGLHRRNR